MIDYDYIECGDCLELMKELPDKSIDLLLTDPPYNVARKNNFNTMGRTGLDFGEWDKGFDQEAWLHSIDRILSDDASVVIFNTFQNLTMTQSILEQYGFVYKDFIIMNKRNPMPRNRDRRYINSCEYALFMTRKNAKWKFNRQSDKYDSNLICCNVVSGKEKTKHTTQKPLSVIKELVLRHSDEGDVVLDPFMGSGTTCVACVNTGRHYIGFEKEPEYYEIACKRLDEIEKAVSVC